MTQRAKVALLNLRYYVLVHNFVYRIGSCCYGNCLWPQRMLLPLLRSELFTIFHLLACTLLVLSANVRVNKKGLCHQSRIFWVLLTIMNFWSGQWGFILAAFMCVDYPAGEHKIHSSKAVILWPSRSMHQILGKVVPTRHRLQVLNGWNIYACYQIMIQCIAWNRTKWPEKQPPSRF